MNRIGQWESKGIVEESSEKLDGDKATENKAQKHNEEQSLKTKKTKLSFQQQNKPNK